MAPKAIVKLPYYLRALVELRRIATSRSIGRCLIGPTRRLQFRDGWTLELSSLLDLLVVKETLCDDVYGLNDIVAADGVVVDVGAGVGDFTIAAARRFPHVTIVAYEPSPLTFGLLERNVKGGGLTNVRLNRAAIGGRSGYLLVSPGQGARASALGGHHGAAVPVDGVRLQDAVPDGPIRLLKIDCEGMELDVLESGAGVMHRVERVEVEFHRHLLPDADERVLAFLRASGFAAESRVDPYDSDLGFVSARRLL